MNCEFSSLPKSLASCFGQYFIRLGWLVFKVGHGTGHVSALDFMLFDLVHTEHIAAFAYPLKNCSKWLLISLHFRN